MARSTKIFRAYKTLMKMLKDRGYLINDALLNITSEEIQNKMKSGRIDSSIGGDEVSVWNLNNVY